MHILVIVLSVLASIFTITQKGILIDQELHNPPPPVVVAVPTPPPLPACAYASADAEELNGVELDRLAGKCR